MIKAIDTKYNGYKFRSRLEARWAVFFDELGIKYEYEPEGFELSNGERYLPDFYLPDFSYYVEVKGKNDHLGDDLDKVACFVKDNKTAVLVLSQIPYDEEAKGLYWFPTFYYLAKASRWGEATYLFFITGEDDWVGLEDDFAIGKQKHWVCGNHGGYEHTNEWFYDNIQAISGSEMDEEYKEYQIKDTWDLSRIDKALLKARQARFEHGEKP